MKRTIAGAVLAVLLARAAPAQFFIGGATEITQLANHVELLTQAATQARMLADMAKNSKINGRPNYANVAAELQTLASLIQTGQAIAYSTARADVVFRQRFPGYGPVTGGTYYDQYRVWSQTSLDTVAGVLRGLGHSNATLIENTGSLMQILRSNLMTSDGRLLALQAMGQIADNQNTQLEHLRTLLMLNIQTQAAMAGYQLQKDAMDAATAERFFRFSGRPYDSTRFKAGP